MVGSSDDLVHHRSPVDAKIALFRSLFRGRNDVYARRFESRKTGKSGYQPACANQWARGLCEKPKVRCSDCVVPLDPALRKRFTDISIERLCKQFASS